MQARRGCLFAAILTSKVNQHHWQDAGYGLAGMSKRVFEQTEGLPEFESWGGEDEVFARRGR